MLDERVADFAMVGLIRGDNASSTKQGMIARVVLSHPSPEKSEGWEPYVSKGCLYSTPALLLKNGSDLARPSFRLILGSQPSRVRALVMSGRRRVGSS